MTTAARPTTAFAGAKINLSLRVIERRADGYHEMDSLVVHASDVGDTLSLSKGDGLSLALSGPFGGSLSAQDDNLILRAAKALGITDAAFALEKHLPIAGGVGGGSADAAAALGLLNQVFDLGHEAASLARIGVTLGADVPMCLNPVPKRVGGIGDQITAVPLPPLQLVVVNPGVAVPTGEVFQRLDRFSPPAPAVPKNFDSLAAWIGEAGNDLLPPALTLAPEIGEVLDVLEALPTARASGLSGSGATCFALFETHEAAHEAADIVIAAHPLWWCKPAQTEGS